MAEIQLKFMGFLLKNTSPKRVIFEKELLLPAGLLSP
jgi:hypothetical protein